MRFRRKLWFRIVRKHKWKLLAAAFLVVAVHVLYKKITLPPSNLPALCEPIDVVYTWVNGSDPAFINSIKQYDPSFDPARFDDKNELKFSLRSLEKYAPWIRHIYIVTNGQIPMWLDLTNDRITIVPHELIALNLQWLPTFSSAAIETFLHRIPNLSKRFLYLNDDIFLGTDLYPEDLYTDSEGVRIYQAWLVPDCAEDCPWTYIGDGACDQHCNIEACQYDGNDCSDDNSSPPDIKKRTEEYNMVNVEDKEALSKLEIKQFPKRHPPLHSKVFTYKNNTFKNILTTKNLSTPVELKNVVDTFNKQQQQAKLQPEKHIETLIQNPTVSQHLAISSKDIYSQSLIYTNMLLNRQYGFRARNVLGHVGFLLEKAIVEAMQETFYTEIVNTAKHRFRAPNDLQFAFTYYSFLMGEMRSATVREIFSEFDTDHSLTWSDREIRTFLAKVFPLPLDWSAVRFFEEVIQNCSLNTARRDNHVQYTTLVYERYEDSNLPTVSRDLVENCSPLAEALEANFAQRSKYKFHINSKRMYNNFMMLTSNVTDVINALDKIRRNPRKFNCINDNLESRHSEDNDLIRHLLQDFYLSLFPQISQFELKPQYRNRFDNWRDYVKWRRQQRAVLVLIYGLSILILYYLIRSICIHKAKFVRRCIQKL